MSADEIMVLSLLEDGFSRATDSPAEKSPKPRQGHGLGIAVVPRVHRCSSLPAEFALLPGSNR
jgi:hypothetical protein